MILILKSIEYNKSIRAFLSNRENKKWFDNKLFGSIKLEEDSVVMQRRWRDGE